MRQVFKPWGRAVKYGVMKRRAERVIASPDPAEPVQWPQAAFLIGCGRSGTTVLGEVLDNHPSVYYLYEPYHLWATIDPTIDVLNLYYIGAANFLLDGRQFTPEAQRRFRRLILDPGRQARVPLVLEKTPFNAARIGYLEEIAPGSRYVHLIRDGVDIARSIGRLSQDHSYRIVGKAFLNRWWGRSGCKWTSLAEDGINAGYFPEEVHLLKSYESKGAYEWIVSLGEVDKWRSRLGNRLLEMTYDRLTSHSADAVREICEFLDLKIPPGWLERESQRVDEARRNSGPPLVLPPRICQEFNRLQERFGFAGRAVPGKPADLAVQMAIVSNEPTPYRVHVLNRLARELSDVTVHNIFTHTISNPSMPWEMQIRPEVNPVFFPRHHLTAQRPMSWRSIPLFLAVRKYLIESQARMIILLGYNDLTRMLLMGWARRQGIPIILAGDSNVFAEGRVPFRTRLIKRLYVRWVLRRIHGLMPMGTCGRAFFRLYYDHNLPEFLFPYEPDYENLKKQDPEKVAQFCAKFNLDPQRKRLLYCGRLIGVKRVDDLIHAFARLAAARPDWDLVIAGDGPLRKELEHNIPAMLRPRVKWVGFLQFDQIVQAYYACHALVHPSEFEPWGLVINEAVACNLPVITTSVVGSAVELVRHGRNGMIVPPRSIEALTEAILYVTAGDRHLEMRAQCAAALDYWRKCADPVEGVRKALRHFSLIWREPATATEIPPQADKAAAQPVVAQTVY